MDVGDHEFLQVRYMYLCCDTKGLDINYVLTAGISPLPVEEPPVFMVSPNIDNRWDITKSLYIYM